MLHILGLSHTHGNFLYKKTSLTLILWITLLVIEYMMIVMASFGHAPCNYWKIVAFYIFYQKYSIRQVPVKPAYVYQSINQTSIAPISPAKPGSVGRQPNQCSTAKSRKQFRNINRPPINDILAILFMSFSMSFCVFTCIGQHFSPIKFFHVCVYLGKLFLLKLVLGGHLILP